MRELSLSELTSVSGGITTLARELAKAVLSGAIYDQAKKTASALSQKETGPSGRQPRNGSCPNCHAP
jgi:hypothetical protein